MTRFVTTSLRFATSCIALAVALTALMAEASNFTWVGNSGNNWNVAANWSTGTAPSGSITLLDFPGANGPSQSPANTIVGITTQAFNISGTTAYTFNGQALNIASGTVTNTSTATQTFNSMSLTGPVTFTGSGKTSLAGLISGITTLSGATVDLLDSSSVVDIAVSGSSSSTLTVGGSSIQQTAIAGGLTGTSNLTVFMQVSGTSSGSYDELSASGVINFGGNNTTGVGGMALNLNFTGLTLADVGDVADRGTVMDLFDATSFSGNVGSITSTGTGGLGSLSWSLDPNGVTSPTDPLKWWRSSEFGPNGNYFGFNPGTGELVVVPEPSAVMIAGLGVALAGWKLSRTRKTKKAAAAKA